MPTFDKIIEPEYFKLFQCITSACQDSCCTGWDVVIDKDTYRAYQECHNPVLEPLFREHIKVSPESTTNPSHIPYAQITMNNLVCPFLTDDCLCIIQKTLDSDSLSITCDTYPRAYNNIDGVLERSLYLSCPRAAELALLKETPMEFEITDSNVSLRNENIPILNSNDDLDDKPYRYFHELRFFVINLLQDRTYPLWQRLVILSVFCNRLDQIQAENYDEDVPYIVEIFGNKVANGEFRESMNAAGDGNNGLELQLQAMQILIDHRLSTGLPNKRFSDYVDEFKKGIGNLESIPLEIATSKYTESFASYYQPLMEKYEYILENYLVNYVFKNLFPFGPQKSIYYEQRSIYDEYVLLILHYSIIKTMLIGIAGYHRDAFSIDHVTNLIQVFAKAIEHNLPYQSQAVQFIKANNLNNTSGMTTLIRN